MTNFTQEIRETLMAAKTVEGTYFSQFTGHVNVATADFETKEQPQVSFTGFICDEEEGEEAAVWLHKYTWGWVLELDSGDKTAILS